MSTGVRAAIIAGVLVYPAALIALIDAIGLLKPSAGAPIGDIAVTASFIRNAAAFIALIRNALTAVAMLAAAAASAIASVHRAAFKMNARLLAIGIVFVS